MAGFRCLCLELAQRRQASEKVGKGWMASKGLDDVNNMVS
jgi:hypothetical protein